MKLLRHNYDIMSYNYEIMCKNWYTLELVLEKLGF